MQSSSPLYFPQTPSTSRFPLQHMLINSNSSPLFDSPGMSSPIAAAQARRKSQYKSHVPVTPSFSRSSSGSGTTTQKRLLNSGPGPSCLSSSIATVPKKALAQDRLNCYLEKAGKAREKAVRGRRSLGVRMPKRDEFAMDDDEEEDDDDIMQDELFRRIMTDTNRKQRHSYKISYAIEVGSSFDPDLEDVGAWERELADVETHTNIQRMITEYEDEDILPPSVLDEEEIQEYVEEYAKLGYANSEDLVEDQLLAWSDGEELSTITFDPSQDEAMSEEDVMNLS